MPVNQPKIVPDQLIETIVDTVLQRSVERSPNFAHAIVYCSVPRWFDAEVVVDMCTAIEAPTVSTDEIFQYLRLLPFSQPHPTREATWMYREDFRAYLLKRKEVTDHWAELQARAADSFQRRFEAKTPAGEQSLRDPDVKNLAVERVYHLHNLDPQKALEVVKQICAEMLAIWTFSSGRPEVMFCSEFLGSLDWPYAPEQIKQEFDSLRASIRALLTENDFKALDMLYNLAGIHGLTPEQEASLRDWIGGIHLWDEERLAQALEQFKIAERLTPKDAVVQAHIAEVYYLPGPTWGRFDLAQQHAQEAVKLAPDKAYGYVALGKIAELQERYEEAIEWYQKAIEAEPQMYSGYLPQSEAYSAYGKWSQALAKIDEAVKVSPDIKYHALVRRGNVYSIARQYPAALSEYDQAIAEAPDRIDAYLASGRVLEKVGQSVEAEKAYYKTIELDPEVAQGYVALAELFVGQEKWEKAISICQKAVDKGVKAKDLYRLLRDLYRNQGRMRDSLRIEKQLIHLDPAEKYVAHCQLGDYWVNKAGPHRDIQDREAGLKKAQSEFEKAQAIDPNRAWAYLSFIRLAILRNDKRTAQQQQKLLDAHAPWAHYEMLVALGRAYLENFQYAEADETLQAAVALAPQRIDGWQALSELYNRQGDPASVVRVWSELVKINPTLTYDKHLQVGDAYFQVRDYKQAREAYTQAKELEPDTYLAYFKLANLDTDEGQWEEAIDNYRSVENKAPGFAALAYARTAKIYKDQGRYDEAKKAARTAILLDGEEPDGYIELARLGIAQGEEDLVKESSQGIMSVAADKLYDFTLAIGDEYELAEDVEKAEQAYQQCIELDDKRLEAYIRRGLLRLNQRHYRYAEKWLTKALKIDRTSADAYQGLSRVYEEQGNLERVVEIQNKVVEIYPYERYNAYLTIGEMYEKTSQLEEAERQIRAAIRLHPWRAGAYANLGSLLRKRGKPEKARKAYREAKDAADISYVDLGLYYERQKKLDDATEVYRLGIKIDPKNPEAYVRLAQMLADQDRPDEALEVCEQMAAQPELFYAAQLSIGTLQEKKAAYDEAAQAYQQAIKREPKQAEAYVRWAEMLADQDRLDEALEVCEQMAEQPELFYAAQLSIGRLQAEQGANDKAIRAYQQAIETNPKRAEAYLELAGLHYQQNKWDEMERLLQQASEAVPQAPEPFRFLAQLREQQKRWDEAMELYRRVVELEPDGAGASAAFLRMGTLLLREQRYEEAAPELQQAVQRDPGNAEAYYSLGVACEQQGKVEQAIESYSKATKVAPKYGEAYMALGRLYAKQGDTKSLAGMARQILALELNPVEQYDAYLLLAQAYQTAKDAKQATDYYRQAIKRETKRAEAYVQWAEMLVKEGRVDEALAVCEQMAAQPELFYAAQLSIGTLQEKKAAYDEAAQAYQQAIKREPKQAEAYVRWAEMLADQDRLDEALEVCEQMAEQPELFYAAQLSIGRLQAEQGANDKAIRAYQQAIETNPKRAEAYLELAGLHYQQNKWDEMERLLQQASEAVPQAPEPFRFLAQLREQQKRWDEAMELYRRVVELEPDGAGASAAFLRMGTLLLREQRYEEAAPELQQAVQRDPGNAEAYYSLGVACEQQGKVEQAIESYSKATKVAPKYGEAYMALGRLYAKQGDTKSLAGMARQILALELNPVEQYDAYLLLAQAYQTAGFYEWAIDYLSKAVSLDPQRFEAYSALGLIYETQQRWAKAREMYGRIGELIPKLQPDVHLRRGQLFVAEENPEEAEKEFRQVSNLPLESTDERFGQLTSGYLNIASIYRRQGKQEALRKACAEVLSLVQRGPSPDHNALRHQGLAYLMRGEFADAAQTLYRCLEADPTDVRARLYLAVVLLPQGMSSEAQSQLRQAIGQVENKDDYNFAIEETEALAMHVPEVVGAKEMLRALREAKCVFPDEDVSDVTEISPMLNQEEMVP